MSFVFRLEYISRTYFGYPCGMKRNITRQRGSIAVFDVRLVG